ncbi:ATP-grasp domain-containing protein [Luteipulveratus sp. YIM 133132]|uniref:preATP grasp domain-containing protein n=1 Tax=Luteipulveratus flavus TaxID=3031728 RepID=UPI0023AED76C|nr:ATP-grasp domain-containing protein [Luteipulveratus sp. YIM 133132]MDE9365076.1 ATP-grasp domain-containing protein [Luteipulveratus sp. YIM 133132]
MPHDRADASAPPFAARLRQAVTGDPSTPLVIVGNFEVEERWARDEVGLPRLTSDLGAAVVNRMDELALLLGRPGDVVVLKSAPDPDHLTELRRIGLQLPTVLAPAHHDPTRSVSQDALADDLLLAQLAALRESGHRLYAHGISDLEEEIARRTGLAVAGPSERVAVHVNSKVYSRDLAQQYGIRQPHGWACRTVEELHAAAEEALPYLDERPLVVKEALGVSGKGIAVVDTPARLRRIVRMIARRAGSQPGPLGFCIEQWLDKDRDFNYQLTVDAAGRVHFDFVKEALTAGGVHQGHRFPAVLPEADEALIRETADVVGAALARDGFAGVVGIDALTERDGTLHPLIEINARNNMSTYQLNLQEQLVDDGQAALARHYEIRSTRPVPFAAVREALADAAYDPARGTGAVVQGFATVNAAHALTLPDGAPVASGRLYALVIGDDDQDLAAIDGLVRARLDQMQEQAA